MSFESNDVLANLFANAIRSPQPSTSAAAAPGPATRPSLAHSKSIGAEPTTPRRPQAASGKRVPRRSTASFSSSGSVTGPVPLLSIGTHHHSHQSRKGGSMSPPSSSHHHSSAHHHHHSHHGRHGAIAGSGSASPFAGAKFSDSPSARAVPLPPSVWFEDDESPCPPSDTESISSFATSSSSSSSDSDDLPRRLASLETGERSPSRRSSPSLIGVRVTPLQLIAAVSAL